MQPDIIVTAADYDRLSALAERALRNAPDAATFLLEELDRATITSHRTVAAGMGSHVRFRDDAAVADQHVQLVYPPDADPARGRISVLTPVGAALLGLSTGQSIGWRDRRGALKTLTVLDVQHEAKPVGQET